MLLLAQIEALVTDWHAKLKLILAAAPVISDLLTAGPDAFATFLREAPDAENHLKDLQEAADALKRNAEGPGAAPATPPQVAAVAAHLIGINPPGWSDASTERWWNRSSEF